MIPRTNFFVASLWAPLPPVGLIVGASLWILLFPQTIGFVQGARAAASVALIAVPLAYAILFAATYLTARLLYALDILSIWALLVVSALVSFVPPALVWTSDVDDSRVVLVMVVAFLASLLALASASLVWWRVVLSAPVLDPVYEKRRSRSGSRRRRSESSAAGPTVSTRSTDLAEDTGNELIVRWNSSAGRLQIVHPDRSKYPAPLAEFDENALAGMSAQDAARLIGEPLTRLLRPLRSRYNDPSKPRDS